MGALFDNATLFQDHDAVSLDRISPAFAGEPAAGPWSLDVTDIELGSVGTLGGWSLSIVGNCSPATN